VRAAALLLALAACDQIIDLKRVGPMTALPMPELVQQVNAFSIVAGTGPYLSFDVAPTSTGNTLILAITIRTTSKKINYIEDPGGTMWQHALDGDFSDTNGERVEIWYAANAASTSHLTVHFESTADMRVLAVAFTEWRGLASSGAIVAAHTEPYTGVATTDIPTGPIVLSRPGLVFATCGFDVTDSAELANQDFTALETSTTGNPDPYLVTNASAYATKPAGTYSVDWTVSTAQIWNSGIVAFELAE
jgi:hypothetical protein